MIANLRDHFPLTEIRITDRAGGCDRSRLYLLGADQDGSMMVGKTLKAIAAAAAVALSGGGACAAQAVVNSDAALNTGYEISVTTTPADHWNVPVYKDGGWPQLWLFHPDCWGLWAGSSSGTIKMSYGGAGSLTSVINMTGIKPSDPNAPVDCYPSIVYGRDPWGYSNGDQGPAFAMQLKSAASLYIEYSYMVGGVPSGNNDVVFDLWLMPTNTYNGGAPGAVEVEVLPYFDFPYGGRWGTYVKTVSATATVNGVATTIFWDMYKAGNGPGSDILFYPSGLENKGALMQDARFDFLPLLMEAAGPNGANVGTDWWMSGIQFGSEFGKSATQRYTLTIDKLRIEQTMK